MVIIVGKNFLQVNAYILKIGGIDMIMGVEWSKTLGEVNSYWKKRTMSYEQGGCIITL